MDPGGEFYWLLHPVQLLSDLPPHPPGPLQGPFSQGSLEAGGTIPPNAKGNQNFSTRLHQKGVLIFVLPGPKVKWRVETNSGPRTWNPLVFSQ